MKLNNNLTLNWIAENNSKDEELITVELCLTFLEKKGKAYVVIKDLDDEYSRYAMTEIASEVSSSFNNALEEEDVWKKIVLEVKKYVAEWKIENNF